MDRRRWRFVWTLACAAMLGSGLSGCDPGLEEGGGEAALAWVPTPKLDGGVIMPVDGGVTPPLDGGTGGPLDGGVPCEGGHAPDGRLCTCEDDTGCDDHDACTVDLCGADQTCEHEPAPDGTVCPGGSCEGGSCVPPGCGPDGSICDDGNECTADACAPWGCTFSWLPDGTPCSQGTCQSGSCTPTACGVTDVMMAPSDQLNDPEDMVDGHVVSFDDEGTPREGYYANVAVGTWIAVGRCEGAHLWPGQSFSFVVRSEGALAMALALDATSWQLDEDDRVTLFSLEQPTQAPQVFTPSDLREASEDSPINRYVRSVHLAGSSVWVTVTAGGRGALRSLRLKDVMVGLSVEATKAVGARAQAVPGETLLRPAPSIPHWANIRGVGVWPGSTHPASAYPDDGRPVFRLAYRRHSTRGNPVEGLCTGAAIRKEAAAGTAGLLITNTHCLVRNVTATDYDLPVVEPVAKMVAQFDYEFTAPVTAPWFGGAGLGIWGSDTERDLTAVELRRALAGAIQVTNLQLVVVGGSWRRDYAVLRPRKAADVARIPAYMIPNRAGPTLDSEVFIHGHPNGHVKQAHEPLNSNPTRYATAIATNYTPGGADDRSFVHYWIDTIGGNSGSPVKNRAAAAADRKMVAIHHGGVQDPMTSAIIPGRNEGVRMDVVMADRGVAYTDSDDESPVLQGDGVTLATFMGF